jgi:hypothetical protein
MCVRKPSNPRGPNPGDLLVSELIVHVVHLYDIIHGKFVKCADSIK